jgi:hypothetical protein
MLPSVKTLTEVFNDNSKEARRVLSMQREELEQLPACIDRIKECYRQAPSTSDLRMTALNVLADTYGVESFQLSDGSYCVYLNAGETYAATLVLFHGKYRVSTLGDIFERYAEMHPFNEVISQDDSQ